MKTQKKMSKPHQAFTKPYIELVYTGDDGQKRSRTFTDNKFAGRGQQLAGYANQVRPDWFKEESAAN